MENLKQQQFELYLRFKEIHSKLLELKQWQLANDLSDVYHNNSIIQYKSGVEFIKTLYNL